MATRWWPGLVRIGALIVALTAVAAAAPPRWKTLPLPPAMPAPASSGYVDHAGARIYYATYGEGPPVILLHGGMGNGDHFGFQLPALVDKFRVIAIDSRGQGRSSLGAQALTYHLMATDVVAVMDALKLPAAAFAGWSDGGVIALDLAITAPERVSRLFVIGTNYDGNGSKPRRGRSPATFDRYVTKCRADHKRMTGKPGRFDDAVQALLPLWRKPGGFTQDQLRAIKVPAMVALGDHDEIIELDQIKEMAQQLLPRGELLVVPDTSHFALWQAPEAINQALAGFLAR